MFLYFLAAYICWKNWRLECKLYNVSTKIDALLEKLEYFYICLPNTDAIRKKLDDNNKND